MFLAHCPPFLLRFSSYVAFQAYKCASSLLEFRTIPSISAHFRVSQIMWHPTAIVRNIKQ
jgi:hypothetical protein